MLGGGRRGIYNAIYKASTPKRGRRLLISGVGFVVFFLLSLLGRRETLSRTVRLKIDYHTGSVRRERGREIEKESERACGVGWRPREEGDIDVQQVSSDDDGGVCRVCAQQN